MSILVLLAFSAGLASVLIALGILVVYARGFAAARLGEERLKKSPLLSALAVIAVGFWLCYDSVHPSAPESPPPGGTRPGSASNARAKQIPALRRCAACPR